MDGTTGRRFGFGMLAALLGALIASAGFAVGSPDAMPWENSGGVDVPQFRIGDTWSYHVPTGPDYLPIAAGSWTFEVLDASTVVTEHGLETGMVVRAVSTELSRDYTYWIASGANHATWKSLSQASPATPDTVRAELQMGGAPNFALINGNWGWTQTLVTSLPCQMLQHGGHFFPDNSPAIIDIRCPARTQKTDIRTPTNLAHLVGFSHNAGNPVAVFQAADEKGSQLWLEDGVPVPIRYAQTVNGEERVLYELTQFSRGTGALIDAPGLVSPTSFETPGLAPFQETVGRWGYPLASAIVDAQTCAEYNGFRSRHADAYVMFAQLFPSDAQWKIVMGGGSETMTFMVSQEPGNLLAPQCTATAGHTGLQGFRPAPMDARATSVVSLQSLTEWHDTMADQLGAAPASSYRFLHACHGSCTSATFYVALGDSAPEGTSHSLWAGSGQFWGFSLASDPSPRWHGAGPATTGTQPHTVGDEALDWTPVSWATVAGVGILGGLAGLLSFLIPLVKKLFAGAFFSRIESHHLLQSEARRSIYDAICQHPGIHFQGLARQTGQARGSLEHHVRLMEQHGVISRVTGEGYVCFFIGRATPAQRATPVLKSHTARGIVQSLGETPGLGAKQLARQLAVTPGAVHNQLRRLEAHGVVNREKAAGGSTVWLTPLGRKIVKTPHLFSVPAA